MTPLMSTVIATRRLSLAWYADYKYVGQLFDDRLRRGIRAARLRISRGTVELPPSRRRAPPAGSAEAARPPAA